MISNTDLLGKGRFGQKLQIGPVWGSAKDKGLVDLESFANVVCNPGCCSCRQTDDSLGLDLLGESGNFQILRSERSAPFGDTMGFVNGDESDAARYMFHAGHESFVVQLLWRAIQ